MRHIAQRGEPMHRVLGHFGLAILAAVIGGVWIRSATLPQSAGVENSMNVLAGPSAADVDSPVPAHPLYWIPAQPLAPPSFQASVQATETVSHTFFLPYVAHSRNPVPHLYGVQIYQVLPETVARIAEAEAYWIRLPISWASVEPENTTPENYRWSSSFEAQLRQLAEQNFRVILTLTGNPDWAATYPDGPIDRVDPAELGEFLSAAVARYSYSPYNLKYWEMYNEPDCDATEYALYCEDGGMGLFGNAPLAYAQLLATVYQPMKAVNPEVQVLFGGIAYDSWLGPVEGGPFVEDFLDQVLQYIRDNPGQYFDVMNFHYYPKFHDKWSALGGAIGLIGKTTYLRDKLAFYGLHNKPLICTETGAQSSAAPNAGSDADEKQARYVVQTFARGTAANLLSVIWFYLVDDPTQTYWKTGLLDENLNPRPAFYAYQTVVDQLGTADYVRAMEPGEYNSDSIEGYVFSQPKASTEIFVVWSNDDKGHEIAVPSGQLTVVDKLGSQTILYDGDDGAVDGLVRVAVGPSPIYLRFDENAPTPSHSEAEHG